jgi:predicted acyltransferase
MFPWSRPAVDLDKRLVSLDAWRGLIMLVLVSGTYTEFTEGFGFAEVSRALPDSAAWRFLATQFSHAPWSGCTLWDLVMPSFVFMVGVAMPYSYAAGLARGDSRGDLALHAAYRALVLILLGTVGFLFLGNWLMGRWPRQINLQFQTILPQLGLAYVPVFLLVGRSARVQLAAAFAALAAWWLAFVLYPLPAPGFDYASVGGMSEPYTGFFAHWNKNVNPAAAFDHWLLNLIPRTDPFDYNRYGLSTLAFIPTMANMIFGVMTGEMLRVPGDPARKAARLVLAGLAYLAAAVALHFTLCPIVKSVWTPSWALFSSGWVLLMLAAFYWVMDVTRVRRWSLPLVVVGMNAIAVYCMANLFDYWIFKAWEKSLGGAFTSGPYAPIWKSLAMVATLWAVAAMLFRRRIFIRV